jgi:hypothetical protein
MSIESLTGDEFMRLLPDEHREALDQYNTSIRQVAIELPSAEVGSPEHEKLLDKLSRLATLRKVHKVRLEEMEGEEAVEGMFGIRSHGSTESVAA